MTLSTNVPMPVLGTNGFQSQPSSSILQGVIQDIQAAFGGTLNLDPTLVNTSSLSTPQGQLASSIAAIIADVQAQFLQVTTQVDPQYAQGSMQDAIGNLYFMQRIPATGTSVSATIMGAPNTVLPAYTAIASDYANNLYQLTTAATIGAGGTVNVTFYNVTTGPIAYVPYTGSNPGLAIYQTTPGWSLITNEVLLALGTNVETQQAFEARRQLSLAYGSTGSVQAIRAAVLATSTSGWVINSCYMLDNPQSTAVQIGTGVAGVLLAANSVFVSVYGPSLNILPIAQAIWSKKDAGCAYSYSSQFYATASGTTLTVSSIVTGSITPVAGALNNTSTAALYGHLVMQNGIPMGIVTSQVSGTAGGVGIYNWLPLTGASYVNATLSTSSHYALISDVSYPQPYPTYPVFFTPATPTPVYIQVTLAAASNPPTNAQALLQASIMQAFYAGNPSNVYDSQPTLGIGQAVYGSRFYNNILAAIPNTTILGVAVGLTSSPTTLSCSMGINQIPLYVAGNITVAYL